MLCARPRGAGVKTPLGTCTMTTSVVFYTNNNYDINSEMRNEFDVSSMDHKEAREALLKLELRKTQLELSKQSRDSFITFVKAVWPGFVESDHHRMIAEKFEKVLSGEIKRLIVNMPPRHTKSEFASYLFPAWLLGHKPQTKIIQTTHTAEL